MKRASLAVALGRERHLYPGEAAVFAQVALLQGDTFGLAARNSLAYCLTFDRILWSRDLLEGHAGDFLKRVADDLGETRVAPQVPALKRGMDDADRSLLKGRTVALLAVAEFHLRQLAFGDVSNNAVHLQGLPLGIERESAHSMHPALLLVCLPDDTVFLIEGLSLTKNLFCEIGSHHGAVIGMDQGRPPRHRAVIFLVDSEDPIQYVRACPHLRGNIQNIAAKVSNPLRFSKKVSAFAERFLCLLPFRNVFDKAFVVEQPSIGPADSPGVQRNPDDGAVLAPEAALEPPNDPMLGDLPREPRMFIRVNPHVLNQVVYRGQGFFHGIEAQHLRQGTVHVQGSGLGGCLKHSFEGPIEDISILVLGFLERSLCRLPFRDVLPKDGNARCFPIDNDRVESHLESVPVD